MSRRVVSLLVLCAVLLCLAAAGCIMLSVREAKGAPAASGALAAELQGSVETLCAQPRYGKTLSFAQDFIAAELQKAGYKVRFQEVTNEEGSFRNIIAERKGAESGRLIVGAHYDACEPDSAADVNPGADDNASAVAVLLALARRLPEHPRHSVELVFYACEEPPWFGTEGMGSYTHAQTCDPKETLGMVCLEMLGCYSNEEGSQPSLFPGHSLLLPTQGNFAAVVGDLGALSLAHAAQRHLCRRIRTLRLNVPFAGETALFFSDHRNYAPRGIPAIMVTDTAFLRNDRYHEASDTPDTLDYARMAAVTEGVFSLLLELIS